MFIFCKHLGRVVTVKESVQWDYLGLIAVIAVLTYSNYSPTTERAVFKIKTLRQNKKRQNFH